MGIFVVKILSPSLVQGCSFRKVVVLVVGAEGLVAEGLYRGYVQRCFGSIVLEFRLVLGWLYVALVVCHSVEFLLALRSHVVSYLLLL